MGRVKNFEAVLEPDNRMLGWTIARVPFDPAAAWKEMIWLRVRGEVNGFAFRSSLFPDARGGFYVLVSRAMQAGAGVHRGEKAEFTLEPDLEARPAELPDELAALLEDEPGLREWYDGLSEYMRREMGKWVLAVKSDEARIRRAEQTAERLLATMEAEVELPPEIAIAFRLRPKAKAGWERMSQTKRRAELMAVFHYLSPESRTKRIGKMMDEAEKHGASVKG
ncbi:YdeI/OmpD-associated family protein [Granulicella sp. WH15]|uniref:YdeI/OmpD-associated family protein n=1 Tax=Granulicella sp. WH15 TaxID=2602070 RepID=UPI0021034E1A|nr:YdeI/OmpD-associated family protein [Granulicella sp. WH15]